jgi:endonuclease/exonuclease/phosphatase family metal-dependent hydrolase
MGNHAFWIESLRGHKTLRELKRSAFFIAHGEQISSFLRTPQIYTSSGASPLLHSFLRIAQWNIEKGKRFKEILDRLQTDEILKWADVLIVNESDQGMIRSANRDVARDLAQALQMHAAFGPAHFELTKGPDEERFLEGENSESLQGNAVLSRYPILEACIVPLPVTFEPYEFHEKRFGRRSCLWARLQLRSSCIWVGAVHLELRNTPRCRARQMRHLTSFLPGAQNEAHILGGDLNTNSFARGTATRMLSSVFRLLFRSTVQMKREFLRPESGNEPLFRILKSSGFEWEGMNSNEETARTDLHSLEEAEYLPDPILRWVTGRLKPYGGYLCFKLDWLLGKGVQGLRGGQMKDSFAGISSSDAGVVKLENAGPGRISDHLPIYADVELA